MKFGKDPWPFLIYMSGSLIQSLISRIMQWFLQYHPEFLVITGEAECTSLILFLMEMFWLLFYNGKLKKCLGWVFQFSFLFSIQFPVLLKASGLVKGILRPIFWIDINTHIVRKWKIMQNLLIDHVFIRKNKADISHLNQTWI